jgi:SAM-dependent methyltransferase
VEVRRGRRQTAAVVDRQFADAALAELYDIVQPPDERDDFRFYLQLVMSANAVLDVGCGTGALLHAARAAGHTGRLVGLDPAAGMLAQARKRGDVEWVLGDLGAARWDGEFDLVVMTGHAFQVFTEDGELRAALAAIRAALADGGRFVFETRNPAVRTWEQWVPENAVDVAIPGRGVLRMEDRVDLPVEGDLVSFTTTYTVPGWERPEESRSTLRFLDSAALAGFLAEAGLAVEECLGDWDGSPFTPASPEIIVSACRSK